MSKSASRPARGTRVGVAMSGGVDSSVAAGLLVEQGYDVVGLTAVVREAPTRGLDEEHVERARRVAEFLEIAHVVVDVREAFEQKVVRPFVEAYANGRTPSPCVLCNAAIKFGLLLDKARELECAALATGHYAYLQRQENGWHLLRGWDAEKDQSYFLHRLSQEQLAQTLFPLGLWTKRRVVEWAREMGLPLMPREESYDLCFLENGEYAPFVTRFFPELNRPGEIQDGSGRVLGYHEGFFRYTIGQRKGLGVAAAEPLYVTRIDAQRNVVVVGPRREALRDRCEVEDVHWIAGTPPDWDRVYRVCLRYRHDPAVASLRRLSEGAAEIHFIEPQFAVAPGQAAVVYDDNEVLGGGWIRS